MSTLLWSHNSDYLWGGGGVGIEQGLMGNSWAVILVLFLDPVGSYTGMWVHCASGTFYGYYPLSPRMVKSRTKSKGRVVIPKIMVMVTVRTMVLNWGWFCLSWDISQYLWTFLVITTGGMLLTLIGRGRRCSTAVSLLLALNKLFSPKCSSSEAENPCYRRKRHRGAGCF